MTIDLPRSKSEFISHELIQNFLDDDTVELDKDIQENARSLLDSKVYTRESYEEVGIDCGRLLLPLINDPRDPAEEAYLETRTDSSSANIIFCTHAMLAFYVFSKRMGVLRSAKDTHSFSDFASANDFVCESLLEARQDIPESSHSIPSFGMLIVDEAHRLEDSYRSIFNRKIAIDSLKRAITGCVGENLITKKNSDLAIAIISSFQDKLLDLDDSIFPRKLTTELYNNLSPVLVMKKKRIVTKNGLFLQESLDSIKSLSSSSDLSHAFYVSPVRKALSIQNTSTRPAPLLDMTWKMSPKALLLSGTLASGYSRDSYSMMGIKLAIPTSRMKGISPIESSWLRDNVTLHTPKISNDQKSAEELYTGTGFYPPKHAHSHLMQDWCCHQSDYIARTVKDITGGSIVFCTSYDQVELLHSYLEKELSEHANTLLLKSTHGVSMSSVINKFKKAHAGGLQPVWIAISSIGTGVDMTDMNVKAEDDNLVQAIYLTRIPYSGAKSNVNKNNFLSSLRDSLILSKQMLGRLVRRPGRNSMHIHLMDARFNIKKGHYRMYKELTENYQKVEFIEKLLLRKLYKDLKKFTEDAS